MGFYYWDPTMIILIPAILLSMWASWKVNSAYKRYSVIENSRHMTGAQAARIILDRNGLNDVQIGYSQGKLSDHYDPRKRLVNLSAGVHDGTSIASVAVASHEVGHAVQHAKGYAPLGIRNAIAPIASIASNLSFVFIFAGLIFGAMQWFDIGIIMFTAAVVFQIITLPVEFNASSRATRMMQEYGIIDSGEVGMAKSMLSSAAMTYVAATLQAVLQLLRLVLLRNSRD